MCNAIKYLVIPIAVCLVLLGCSSESDSKENPPQPKVTTPAAPVTPVAPSRIVDTLSLAGITLEVTIGGTLSPSAELDVALVQTSGSPAIAIRLWVGDESGLGSVKIKVHSHGASYHAVPQAPSTLPENCALWIEVQSATGEREAGSISLQ